MTLRMYDLVAADDRRPSPFCWRARMAIAHKGLACETVPTGFKEIASISDGEQRRVPVLEDGDRVIADSWAIAEYLEDAYPEAPSLFADDVGQQMARFIKHWTETQLMGRILTLVVKDVHDHIRPEDQAYFRASRERRFGSSLEAVQEGREDRLAQFHELLAPLALTLEPQPYLGGETPHFADHIVFGAFQWPRVISGFKVMPPDGPIAAWFERCLDLYGGIGRAAAAFG